MPLIKEKQRLHLDNIFNTMKRSLRKFVKNPVDTMNAHLETHYTRWPFPYLRIHTDSKGRVNHGVMADGRYFARLGNTFAITQ